jgi:hypothetical protein
MQLLLLPLPQLARVHNTGDDVVRDDATHRSVS